MMIACFKLIRIYPNSVVYFCFYSDHFHLRKMALSQLKGSEVKITPNERENKYKVGDYVYIEQSQSDPFVIRRIEELQKTAQGNVAAKVVCFYERVTFIR